jgi:glycosyltransferase involved in cell wall biosynthesis
VRYRAAYAAPLRLVFAGRADVALPEHPDVVYTGFVSEAEKQQLLRECSLLVLPSAFESLSIVCLEAWAAGRPTLVNGGTLVLREQTLRSQGGLFYTSYDEFAACLDLLLADEGLRRTLGRQGRRFVERRYSWPVVERRLARALHAAALHAPAVKPSS